MALILNEEERLLKDTAREFLAANAPVSALRALRDSRDATGYSGELWSQMAELGWAGIVLPEDFGGLAFGFQGLGQVFEEMGRTLTASPLFATVALGAQAILLGGSEAQKAELLPQVAEGRLTLALALEEGPHHNPAGAALKAEKSGSGFVLNGSKTFVLDGHSADKLVVAARTAGQPGEAAGISLFLVDGRAAGLTRNRTVMVDSRNAANLVFEGVQVGEDALIGELDKGWQVLDGALDRGRILLSAEMLGSCLEVFERTVGYLKERKQFGVLIGTFQALKHRAAFMFTELELAKSVVLDALSAIDEGRWNAGQMASLAKARLNEVSKLVSNEAVQMHGGIGVTDELEIGLFLKRLRACAQILGDLGFHKDRYASFCGY